MDCRAIVAGISLLLVSACGPDGGETNNVEEPAGCDEAAVLGAEDVNGGVTLAAGECYRVEGILEVVDGTLTLERGVWLVFAQNAGLSINNEGALHAVGTAGEPIVFTGEEASRGYWRGVQFLNTRRSENALEHVVIEHAGRSNWGSTDGELSQGAVVVTGNVNLRVASSTFRDNEVAGFTARGEESTLELSANRFSNTGYGIRIHGNHLEDISDDQVFEENDNDYVLILQGLGGVSSYITRDQVWPALEVPYRAERTLYLYAATTFSPGLVIEFPQNTGLEISEGGSLTANAEGGEPIVLRGVDDVDGYWRGLYFLQAFSSQNVLRNIEISGAGHAQWHTTNTHTRAAIALMAQSRVEIDQARITGSGHHGIYAANESVVVGCENLEFESIAGTALLTDEGNEANVCW